MGRKRCSPKLKNAWIDRGNRSISFTQKDDAEVYLEKEDVFWANILHLMRAGYRMQ